MSKKYLLIIALLIIAAILGIIYLKQAKDKNAAISNFEECAAASNVILESYPAQCRTKDGRSFTQEIGNELEYVDEITVSSPRPNQTISSPLQLSGHARGSWFFEATAPVAVTDENGNPLGQGYITAEGEWMTTDFVSFAGTSTISPSTTNSGWVIFSNANPSDLSEKSKQLKIPVRFQ